MTYPIALRLEATKLSMTGSTIAEIAKALTVPPGTVARWLNGEAKAEVANGTKLSRAEAGRLGQIKARKQLDANDRRRRQEAVVRWQLKSPKCEACGVLLAFEKRDNRFCGRGCANSRMRRHEPPACKHCSMPTARARKGWFVYCSGCIEAKIPWTKGLAFEELKTEGARRRFLFRNKQHKCENPSCGISEWQGQPAPLEMDHIDGNSDNNVLDNMRLLCSNCHSQQPTSKGRNKGNGGARQKMMQNYKRRPRSAGPASP